MLLGVEHALAKAPVAAAARLEKLTAEPKLEGHVTGNGPRFVFDYRGPDAARALNALLKQGARATFEAGEDKSPRVAITNVTRKQMEDVATAHGLDTKSQPPVAGTGTGLRIRAPRVGMYQPFGGGNMDEGWTRWVLEQYGFQYTTLHNADVRAGALKDKYDAIILPDQGSQAMINGSTGANIRPEYSGGIGTEGVDALKQFVGAGGTLITLGAASAFAIENFAVPVRDLKRGLTRDQHFAPGTILNLEIDTTHPVGFGLAAETYGFYNNSPFFALVEGFASQRTTVVARYPNDRGGRVRLAAGRRADDRPRGRCLGRDESRPDRAVWTAPAASRTNPRDVPDAVQRLVPVDSGGTRRVLTVRSRLSAVGSRAYSSFFTASTMCLAEIP